MKKTAKLFGAAGLAAIGFAGMALAQLSGNDIRSSYPLEAPKALKVFEGSAKCLPGRGGPGRDPTAARVEIRAVKYGPTGIVPLSPEKESDESANPLLVVTRIGAGVVGSQPGRFSVCVPREALMNTVSINATADNYRGFFARVYDAPTVAEANYYIDSELVGYNPSQLYTNLVFAQTSMKSISGEEELDSDDDGLIDRLEWQYGTNYKEKDSDGDGILDGVEVAYGLDPCSPLSITALSNKNDDPAVSAILGGTNSEWHVEWGASMDSELVYKLQLVYDVKDWEKAGDGDDDPNVLDTLTIKGPITQTNWAQDITDWVKQYGLERGFLRLKLEFPDEE